MSELLAGVGFVDIIVDDLDVERQRESIDEWWSEMLGGSGPLAALLRRLPDQQRAAVRDAARSGALAYADAAGRVSFPARVAVASARRAS